VRDIDKTSWGLAVLSGVLQVLVFPLPGQYWLCWVALAPLIVAILGARRREVELLDASGADLRPLRLRSGFVIGYVSGIIWYGGTCHWVYHSMHVYGRLSAPLSAGILVLFCLYLGLYHGLFGFCLALAARRRAAGIGRALLLVPFLWVAIELARARITGFPWDLLGTAQVNNIPLSRLATFTGVYGLSFEIALINTAFAAAFLVPRSKRITLFLAALITSGVVQAGVFVNPRPAASDHIAVLVQENIPILDPEQWTPEYFASTIADLSKLSVSGALDAERTQGVPGLVVWPESPAPFFATDPTFRRDVSEVAALSKSYIMAGSLGMKYVANPQRPPELYNSAALIGPNGDWVSRYDKVHLVPFGEYVPFKSLFVFAEKLTREVGDFTPGAERKVLDLGSFKIGAFICYESIFPDEIREFAQRGAQVFVNISNDGWFGASGAPGQHLNMARMRAIENQRWLLRATNTGITASIDPYGRVVARAPANERVEVQAPYALVSSTTFYTRHGDWFAWLCVIISISGLALRVHASGRMIWSKVSQTTANG
jgi:apolipoprotein N-acyltransferase